VCGSGGACENVGIICQDPSDTTIVWEGAAGGKMIDVNGVSYFRINRCTLNGNGTAKFIVDQSWDGTTTGGKQGDTGAQYADDVFENGGANSYGYHCGDLGYFCAETELIRDTFSSLTFGVATCNSNALDQWIWYSTFRNDVYAVLDNANVYDTSDPTCGAGAYHSIGSQFFNSTVGDFSSEIAGNFNLIDNYSSGSGQFVPIFGAMLTMQRNTILNNTTNGPSIQACGNVVLLDNAIKTATGNIDTSPVIGSYSGTPPHYTNEVCGGGALMSMGNTFTVVNPYNISGLAVPDYNVGYPYGDVVDTSGASINTAPPVLPGTPPNTGPGGSNIRAIYEASASGSGSACSVASPCSVQTAICVAATGSGGFSGGNCTGTVVSGNKPVVHLNTGSYSISSTLSVPANSDIQIIGDDWWTKLNGAAGVNPVLKINGPCHVVLRDFSMTATGSTDGLLIAGVDQSGGAIYAQDCIFASSTHSLYSDGLSNALVELHDAGLLYDTSYLLEQTGSNHVNIFFGNTAGAGIASLSGAANAEIIGFWEDNNTANPGINVTGSGSFVYSSANYATNTTNVSADFPNFTGTAALINLALDYGEGVTISGTGTGGAEILALNANNQAGVDGAAYAISNTATGNTLESFGGPWAMTDSPSPPIMSTVNTALQYFRTTKPIVPTAKPPGITEIEMYRIASSSALNALHVTP
jgi:hypothetical protein